MISIKTESFKEKMPLYKAVISNQNPYHESFYMDFGNLEIYFSNGVIFGRDKFLIHQEDGDTLPENIFINGFEFLFLCSKFDSIEYYGNGCFKSKDGGEYKLKSFSEDFVRPNFEKNDEVKQSITCWDSFKRNLKDSIPFIDPNFGSMFNGIYIQGNNIRSLTSKILYNATIEDNLDLIFRSDSIKILDFFIGYDNFDIYTSGQESMKLVKDDLILLFANDSSLSFRKDLGDTLLEKADLSTFIEVEKKKLVEALSFFEFFVEKEKILLTLVDGNLLIDYTTEASNIKRLCSVRETNLKEITFAVSVFQMKKAINTIIDDTILLKVKDGISTISISGKNNSEKQIVMALFSI
ncbi:MAG: hypothetical protein GF311_28285 [Candidatus Lokiarchaeota archaeon]|nr:hypothetical protein [Candidatus Lokiarchaeota archaeon]